MTSIAISFIDGAQIYMYVCEKKEKGGLFGGKKGTSERMQWG